MNQKLYKREGRRFVQVDIPTICDNSGKYYQKDGTFSWVRTEDSIGLCIMSTPKEHVVMHLKSICRGTFDVIEHMASKTFNNTGELPQLHEAIIALIKFRTKLNINIWEYIWAINQTTAKPTIVAANQFGHIDAVPIFNTSCIAGLRQIKRIPQ